MTDLNKSYWDNEEVVEGLEKRWNPGHYVGEGHKKAAEEYKKFFKKGDKVLEVGCGTGMWFEILKDVGLDYTGVDSSSEMIKKAKSKYDATFWLMSGEDLELCDDGFDYVLLNDVVKHVDNPEELIKEALRVAKKAVLITNSLTEGASVRYCSDDHNLVWIKNKKEFEQMINNKTFECIVLGSKGVIENEVKYQDYLYIMKK